MTVLADHAMFSQSNQHNNAFGDATTVSQSNKS